MDGKNSASTCQRLRPFVANAILVQGLKATSQLQSKTGRSQLTKNCRVRLVVSVSASATDPMSPI
jgi:hypothetical protein